MPQKSAIWVKVRAVFSISHTAVALGISGIVMSSNLQGLAQLCILWERRPGPRESADMGLRAPAGQGAPGAEPGMEMRKIWL
jgi:hypothetical protein